MKFSSITNTLSKSAVAVVFFISLCNSSFSQNNAEMGISIGAMQYSGEVGQVSGNFLNPTSQPRPAVSIHYGKYMGNAFMLRGSLTYGQAGAADRLIPAGVNSFKADRNFEFRTTIMEAAATLEVYPLTLWVNPESNSRFRPYILGGVGVFNFKPEGKYVTPGSGTIDWVPLQPLRTAGQGLPVGPGSPTPPALYGLTNSNFHFGIGFRYRLNKWWDLGFEFMNRRANTDYLDDIGEGRFIDFTVFESAFGKTYKAETAKYLSNYPLYNFLNSSGPMPSASFNVGNPRSTGVGRNDYYYTNTIKLIYFFRDKSDNNLKKGIVPCPPQLGF